MSMHHEWLSLIEISGPFLAVPVLKEAFPQGLEELDAAKRKRLRQAYDEWHETQETDDPRFADLHTAWINEVLSRGLELDEDGRGDVLKGKDWCATHSNVSLPEYGVSLSPDFAVVGNDDKPLMLVHAYGSDVDLDATSKLDGWASTPAERMVTLCRATGCRLGLVTNGERWMLVDAPVGAVTTFASWYARIWGQEPVTLQAFVHLLGIRRFFVDESERLPVLFDRSLKFQDEVTDALGEQVRRAVEVLIQALDKADQDRSRELLHGVKEAELYEAALTVMMRLVFLLSAEERGLLLLGDERYEANYALSTLRMQLRAESDEILERRWDAWSRLLAVFRAVYGGIEHENLRLPALGGSLFDPDRFPFLEGRAKDSDWRIDVAKPLPIDNRTVLLLLEAIQQFQGRTLSYRALDVEQIGYVYEGLLERTVKRTAEVTLELDATKTAQSPWVTLVELESARLDGAERLAELLQERSGSSASRVRNDLNRAVDDALADRVLTACHGDTALRDRIKPFGHLVRTDPWGYPLVYPAGAFIVTTGSDRRETGTHYTPKSLTEAIVAETLAPIAYVGPAQGTPRADWALKSPAELLDLKICDPAMGSGAFLVQACRWLADRLVEAWAQAEARGSTVGVDGRAADADASIEPLPRDIEARTVIARRLIAERCLYGVDLNPLAVELAKLSIWLVTLAKGRPFGFLDHNLRCGDSLLGLHRLDQLAELSLMPTGKGQQRLFGQNIQRAVREAIELRQRLREIPIRDIRDVEAMARLDANARQKLEIPARIADALTACFFSAQGSRTTADALISDLAIVAGRAVESDLAAGDALADQADTAFCIDLPSGKRSRHPFHWPLEFPEVFAESNPGFDGIVGNPPFLGGRKISSAQGVAYLNYLISSREGITGIADLVCHFFRLSFDIVNSTGGFGLVATNSISEVDSRRGGLEKIISFGGQIYSAYPNMPWPGKAAVVVSLVFVSKTKHENSSINGEAVPLIDASLVPATVVLAPPIRLSANAGLGHSGSKIMGDGFKLSHEAAETLLAEEPNSRDLIRHLLSGADINQEVHFSPSRCVIDSGSRSKEQVEAYPKVYRRLVEQVFPSRSKINDVAKKKYWWRFAGTSSALYESINGKSTAIACCRVSKHVSFALVPTSTKLGPMVFDESVVVIALNSAADLAILQSTVHLAWVDRWGSKMGTAPRYTSTEVLETFPFPETEEAALVEGFRQTAERYLNLRADTMTAAGKGLTAVYNDFHDTSINDANTVALRALHQDVDRDLLALYGWQDIELIYEFRRSDLGTRFTFSDVAKDEILHRLWQTNKQRHEHERSRGRLSELRPKKFVKGIPSEADATAQQGLNFGDESGRIARLRPMAPDVSSVIVECLRSQPGWLAKADILAATGITDGQWNAAIADLIAGSRVERQGERRGARYRIQPGHRDDHHEGTS